MPVDAQRGRASNAPPHSASIEFELADGRPIGSVALDGGRPARFEGFDELERMIGSIPSRQRPLVLVRAEDGPEAENGLAELTPRELEITVAAAAGASNREIAASLYYSVKSIEAYLTRAYRKLSISGRAELARIVELDQRSTVEDLEVPEPLGAELSGGRAGGPAGPDRGRRRRRRVSVDLLILSRSTGDAGIASARR